mmetsp:Transcript_22026/g.36092  ORF Transcript_22026/g.36092 Transcript_22026/m.36092 type:complete len:265 (-) Transcript_22026:96-890(-)|eukprot:jgi/Bigna1/135253/aug1.28_g9961
MLFPPTARFRRLLPKLRPFSSSTGVLRESKEVKLLRRDLAAAHQLTARYGMDDLVWNHISARVSDEDGGGFLVTPGTMMYEEIFSDDILHSSENVTANVIHGAIYENRPEINAIVHIHTHAVCTVSALPQGLECLVQDAAQFYDNVAYHPWEGISEDYAEQERIGKSIGPSAMCLIMQNHGACTLGKTVGEAWVRAYYLEKVCQVQVAALANPSGIIKPSPEVLKHAAKQYEGDYLPGKCEWPALVRHLERQGILEPIDDDDED